MKLTHFIHASTRPAWTARLVVYIALIVTVSLIVELIQLYVWSW